MSGKGPFRYHKLIKNIIIFLGIIITGLIILLYLNTYQDIPQIKTENIKTAKIKNLKNQSEIEISTEKAQKLSDEISNRIPKNNETHYWSDFKSIKEDDITEYKITFYNNKKEIEYQYEIRITSPSYATMLKGKTYFWQEKTYPLTHYSFESLLQ